MIKYDLDLTEHFGDALQRIPARDREDAKAAVASLVKEEILSYVADADSPVDGHGEFKKLSKEYKKKKVQSGRPGEPNLEYYGDMLQALEVEPTGSKIRVQVKGKESDKAEGHCQHLAKSRDRGLPMRRFIPAKGEVFKDEIMGKIDNLLELYTGD